MAIPKWLEEKKVATRERSKKQETRLAKILSGKTTCNSGAKFGENDVVTDYCEVEAKITAKESYRVTMGEWTKLQRKCVAKKIPLMVLSLEEGKMDLAVISLSDLKFLIDQVNDKED